MNRQNKKPSCRKKSAGNYRRGIARYLSYIIGWVFLGLLFIGNWFVRYEDNWIARNAPSFFVYALTSLGEPSADITDSFGLTGEDATHSTDSEVITNSVFFAGAPHMPSSSKNDVTILDKKEFVVAYSHSLRHPVWCAYRIDPHKKFPELKRPGFKKDKSIDTCPPASSYARTGYDRGHMVPNYAISTRYGEEAQLKTFLMTNIAPQTPELNRGLWREIEHRAADLFTARWGNVWVIVGAISNGCENLSGTDIDVPTKFYQIIVAIKDGTIRILPLLIDQEVPWRAWPRHYLTSVDNIEKLTGIDFFPMLNDEIEKSLESKVPTRLWPVNFWDAFKSLEIHLNERQ